MSLTKKKKWIDRPNFRVVSRMKAIIKLILQHNTNYLAQNLDISDVADLK